MKEMKRLEQVKGVVVEVPSFAKRYFVLYWEKGRGWERSWASQLFTNPESALEDFLRNPPEDCEYYLVVEFELPIPIGS